jgi:hypothetical protein
MRRLGRVVLAGVLGAQVWACTHPRDVVRTRAAREGQCTEEQVQVEELGGGAFRVRGCGPETTYVCNANSSVIGDSLILCSKEGTPSPTAAGPTSPARR